MVDGRFSSREAAAIVAKVARALHAVHEAGWLHLDIQPDNILIDDKREPRLIDFGMLAPRGATVHSEVGCARGGTPEYMAPEQLSLDGTRVDTAADIYGLGAVLYDLLAGTPPQPECLWSGIGQSSERATLRSVPSPLRRICRRSLDPQPRRRFATAFELASALERFVARGRLSPAQIAGGVIAVMFCVGLWIVARDRVKGSSPLTLEISGDPPALVESFLARASDGCSCVYVFLQDGRCVPVGLERHAGSEGVAPPPRIPGLICELLEMNGTFLILILPDSSPSDAPSAIVPVPPLPSLPAGAMARMTGGEISIVERDGRSVSPPFTSLQLHRLRRLQAEIASSTPRFDALLFATGGALEPR